MMDSGNLAYEIIDKMYTFGVKPLIVEKQDYAYIKDPVFDIKRNRVVAEVLKSIIRSDLEPDEKIIQKLCMFLCTNQNIDGSWNEIHVNYNQPSSLITSIVADALLLYNTKKKDKKIQKVIDTAKDYVISQERSPGYFVKSKLYTADHLNVDATCGAFLAAYDKVFSDDTCLTIAQRTAKHICDYQNTDGSYPYIVAKGTDSPLMDVPCIHYQGVTLYYLSKIQEIIQEKCLENNMMKGTSWLSHVQMKNGRFDWSKSGLMFASYLSGAYAFAFSTFMYASQWDEKYKENAQQCLMELQKNCNSLCLRWEKDGWLSYPFSISKSLQSASIGKHSYKHTLYRLGYFSYRELARRKHAKHVDDTFFRNLTNLFKIKVSTVEPFTNYPDLFMSSEIMDCLSYRGINKVS